MRSLDGPVQVAYAVDDVEDAALDWAAKGVGPFFIRRHIPLTYSAVRGVERSFDHSSAYGWHGRVMVELITEHHAGTDRIGPPHGVHHQAFFVDDVASASRELASAGRPEVLMAQAGATTFAMHEAADLGHLIEIYEPNDGLRGFYDMVRNAAEGWNGQEPVRSV